MVISDLNYSDRQILTYLLGYTATQHFTFTVNNKAYFIDQYIHCITQ